MFRLRIIGNLGFEFWKDIEGYEGLYQVSTYGRVKSLGKGYSNNSKMRILTPYKDSCGYLQVKLSKNNINFQYLVHRLVAKEFIPNFNKQPQINHRSEDKSNNRVENLEWCSLLYNIRYGTGIKRRSKSLINSICSKEVYQYDLEGNLLNKYPSLNEVKRLFNYSESSLSSCCNGKRKTAYGYIWKYKEEAI